MVAQHAEDHAARHCAYERPRDERAGLGRTQVQIHGDGGQHEAEDQQVEAVHGVAEHRGKQRAARVAAPLHGFGRRGNSVHVGALAAFVRGLGGISQGSAGFGGAIPKFA
jgi:hypothetical protein